MCSILRNYIDNGNYGYCIIAGHKKRFPWQISITNLGILWPRINIVHIYAISAESFLTKSKIQV
jgi:hypothetical protein